MLKLINRILFEKKYFVGTCVDNPFRSAEELTNIVDNAVDITKDEFLEKVEIDDDLLQNMNRYPDDFEFYKSGDIYYFTHSAIEHFFK